MDIKYKLYPHPVLITDTDDYINSAFSFTADVSKGVREFGFAFSMKLKNKGLRSLIKRDLAEFLIHIECPQTCYRNIVTASENSFDTKIQEKFLNGKVSLCAFIVAKEDLRSYTNSDFNPDYEGRSFFVDRGSILAVGGQYDITIVKDTEELAKIPSIFTICKCAADTDGKAEIDIDGDKIAITLSNSSFQNYKMLTNMPSYLPVFHSMLIFPTLIYVFETLRRDGIEEYEGRRWYAAVKKTLAKYGVNLSEDVLCDTPSYDLAQKLLDMPVERALNAIAALDDEEDE